MASELQFDATTGVDLVADLVATSATLSVVKPDGTQLSAPTVTRAAATLSTTISGGSSTASVLNLASVAGITPGTPLIVTSDGVGYACEAATVDTSAAHVALRTGLPVAPANGDAVQGAALTATVAAPGVAEIGPNFRLRWTYSDGTTTKTISRTAAVVRQVWTAAASGADVRQVLAEMGDSRSERWCAEVADRVDENIKGRLAETGRRPWAFISSGPFRRCALLGIRYELSQRGIAHGGQIYEAQRELRFAFDDALAGVIGSLSYDSDDDGAIDATEARSLHFTIQAVR